MSVWRCGYFVCVVMMEAAVSVQMYWMCIFLANAFFMFSFSLTSSSNCQDDLQVQQCLFELSSRNLLSASIAFSAVVVRGKQAIYWLQWPLTQKLSRPSVFVLIGRTF